MSLWGIPKDSAHLPYVWTTIAVLHMPSEKRLRLRTIDPTQTHEVATWLEANLPPGVELLHTKRMGWMLRAWDSWESPVSGPRDGWREIDSAPDGQLGALLIRYQQR